MAAPLHLSVSLALLLLLYSLCSLTSAKEFLVGGDTTAWTIPSSSRAALNTWAEANRFQVGDSLVWKYDSKKDSVLQVTREGYLSCDTSSPIAEHKDGSTSVQLDKPGPYYFISGGEGACHKGEKLIVVVMSERRHRHAVSPAPSPVESQGPAIAPTAGGALQLAPHGRRGGLLLALALVLMGLAL